MNIDLKDAKTMFMECILMFDGELVFVRGMDQEVASLYYLASGEKAVKPHNSYNKFSPIKTRVGFVNLDQIKTAVYLSRAPVRQFKVGINLNNTSVYTVGSKQLDDIIGEFPYWRGMDKCVKSVYPSLKEAYLSVTEGEWDSRAFDKQFAINRDEQIFYKGVPVGMVKGYGDGISFKGKHKFLESVVRI